MKDLYNLNRFLIAQENSYQTALNEIKNGRKISHWMWFIFPQLDGLGRSEISKKYAIKSKEEALAYLNHDILGSRLIQISKELLKLNNLTAKQIFGVPDVFKLKSSMSLFSLIQKEEKVFKQVLDKCYDGKICEFTEKILNSKL